MAHLKAKLNGREGLEQLRAGASALALVVAIYATSAHAQDAQNAAPNSTSGEAEELSQPEGIVDIVVTARKRADNVQDIPLAVTALNSSLIERANITEAGDIQRFVPNLTFRDDFSTNQKSFVIRGVGTGTNSIGVEGSVGIVVDNVVLGREGAGVSGFADSERIEVLRGPQGTVFGKNASAGVLNIVTKRPNLERTEAFLKGTYGNYDDVRVNGHITGPISEKFGYHLSGFYHANDGYNRNVLLNRRSGQVEEGGARLKLLLKPSDALEIQLLGDYLKSDRLCCEPTPWIALPNTLLDVAVVRPGVARVGNGARDTVQDESAIDNVEQGGVSTEVNVELGEHTITSITAYREWQNQTRIVPDLLPGRIQIIAAGDNILKQKQLTQELRLTSPGTGSFKYVAGLFYFNQKTRIDSVRRGFGVNAVSPTGTIITVVPSNPALASAIDADDSTKSVAAFADGEIKATDSLSILLGGRYSYEERSGNFRRFQAPGAPASHPGFPPITAAVRKLDDGQFTYRLGVQYRFTPSIQGYATYSTGYKGLGIDLNPNLVARVAVVAPEKVKNYEIGLKSQLLDRRLQVNLAGFITKFQNYQGTAFDAAAVGFNLQSVRGLRSDGIEVEFVAIPLDGFRLSGNVAYSDARWTDFTNAGCYAGQTAAQGCVGGVQNLNGVRPPRAPKFSYAINLDYDFEINDSLDGFAGLSYSWRDKTQLQIDNSPFSLVQSYGLLDGTLGVRFADDRYQLAAFAKNIANKYYPGFIVSLVGQPGNYSQLPGAPRTYGLSLSGKF